MLPPQLQQPLRVSPRRGQTGAGVGPLYRRFPPPAAGAFQAANRLRSGPVQPALQSGRGPQPAPFPPPAAPVFRVGFGESFPPGRLPKQPRRRRRGIRLVAFQHPQIIPAGGHDVPAQIPLGLQSVAGDYFPGPSQTGQQFPPGGQFTGFGPAPYPPFARPPSRRPLHRPPPANRRKAG